MYRILTFDCFFDRIGIINIIVESMVFIIFQVLMDHYWQLTIPELIQSIHHVSQINQVWVSYDIFIISNIYLHAGNGSPLEYGGSVISPESSLTILSGSLSPNQTYQFMVIMTNRQNSSLQATGYLLVQVQDSNTQIIVIG
jgi:hypothetical protein